MAAPRNQIPMDRLLAAADAVLEAVGNLAKHPGGPTPYPLDLMGGPRQPACLAPFTRFEIAEACEFLVRLGFLTAPRPGR